MERPLCCSKTKILQRKKAALYFDTLKFGGQQTLTFPLRTVRNSEINRKQSTFQELGRILQVSCYHMYHVKILSKEKLKTVAVYRISQLKTIDISAAEP